MEKMGIEVFRKLAKQQRPAIAKDLESILDKYDKTKENKSTISGTKVGGQKAGALATTRKRSMSK